MVQVDLGEFSQEAHDCNALEDCADPQVNPYPPASVLTVVTSSFEEENPAVADFLGKMSFPADMMNALLAWQDENKASPDETAVYFLTTQKDTWSGWLNDAAKENLAVLLQ